MGQDKQCFGKVLILWHFGHRSGIENMVAAYSISGPMKLLPHSVQ